ncbi:undecaprenyl diphosphate synthase family protein [Geoglobus acetivorans]|uniref:Undecaprenyl diphosphate synthase n=1 Tax=Geoglobus acetivorans TaxID=565033 RepID=A0A0A7GCQ8_GEOAI|nr:Undecaprenyl diphosphate synthase [Geoglobus acetivorans]
MIELIYRLYIRKLEKEVRGKKVPAHIMVITSFREINEGFNGVRSFIRWCDSFDVREITFAINGNASFEDLKKLAYRIPCRACIVTENTTLEKSGEGRVRVFLNALSGRRELVQIAKELAEDVLKGKVMPDAIDEREIEKRLRVKSEPDLILRANFELDDFLIWQSIYSEHMFYDVDWKNLRYIDFLRILREYQKRERRYGR